MCPVCLTNALMIVGGVASTGGLTAAAIARFRTKKPAAPPIVLPDDATRSGR